MLTRLMQGVGMGSSDSVAAWLDISLSVRRTIRRQYSSETDYNTAVWEWYLQNHPAPSWRHVANALYCVKEFEVLEGVKDQVPSLKGESPVLISWYVTFNWLVQKC